MTEKNDQDNIEDLTDEELALQSELSDIDAEEQGKLENQLLEEEDSEDKEGDLDAEAGSEEKDYKTLFEEKESELSKQKELFTNQNQMINRQANELGDLRKKAFTPLNEEQKQALAERMHEDVDGTIAEIEARFELKARAIELEEELVKASASRLMRQATYSS